VWKISRTDNYARQRTEIEPEQWTELWSTLREQLDSDLVYLTTADAQDLRQMIDRTLAYDHLALTYDAQRYREIYATIGILPPDAYMDIALRLVEGCPYNRCHFCSFYRTHKYRLRSETEFLQHIQAVKLYTGRALPMRKDVFVADADAMSANDQTLYRAFSLIAEHFPKRPISTFISSFTRPERDLQTYRTLHKLGLQRVTLGLESGNDHVLSLLGKPMTAQQALRLMQQVKAAGIQLNIVLLIGAGGSALAEYHLRDSLNLLKQLALDPRDYVYLSELQIAQNSPYLQVLSQHKSTHLTLTEIQQQTTQFHQFLRQQTTARIAKYDILEFLD
jgi:radical SAM superfamily enzyme YgiQ (UPF0313 family)